MSQVTWNDSPGPAKSRRKISLLSPREAMRASMYLNSSPTVGTEEEEGTERKRRRVNLVAESPLGRRTAIHLTRRNTEPASLDQVSDGEGLDEDEEETGESFQNGRSSLCSLAERYAKYRKEEESSSVARRRHHSESVPGSPSATLSARRPGRPLPPLSFTPSTQDSIKATPRRINRPPLSKINASTQTIGENGCLDGRGCQCEKGELRMTKEQWKKRQRAVEKYGNDSDDSFYDSD